MTPISPRVLIVDDETFMANMMKMWVTQLLSNSVVYCEHSFDSALLAIRRFEFDLLITDFYLGNSGGSGLQLSEFSRTTRPGMKIMLVSMLDLDRDSQFVSSFDCVLRKPFTGADFRLHVLRLLEHK
jgi:response regulator of citrate/malate metabolism